VEPTAPSVSLSLVSLLLQPVAAAAAAATEIVSPIRCDITPVKVDTPLRRFFFEWKTIKERVDGDDELQPRDCRSCKTLPDWVNTRVIPDVSTN